MENGEMKDRISHIIRAKNLTAAEFAVRLGIQPSNVSHLLSGRNNPSLDFVKKLKETFPEYNLDWLIMGTGPMTVSEPFLPFAPPVPVHEQESSMENEPATDASSNGFASESHPATTRVLSSSTLSGIVLLFDDDTYKILSPR